VTIDLDSKRVDFQFDKRSWEFDTRKNELKERQAAPPITDAVVSPNGAVAAFLKGSNLWIRDLKTGAEKALTDDGAPDFAYASPAGSNQTSVLRQRIGQIVPPAVVWSPDSTHLATTRIDERNVRVQHMQQSTKAGAGPFPVWYSFRSPGAADPETGMAAVYVFDVRNGHGVRAESPEHPVTLTGPIERGFISWRNDGKALFVIDASRGDRSVRLHRVDPDTGRSKLILQETSKTHIDLAGSFYSFRPATYFVGNGEEIIWYSERDGWGHLYLFDGATGELKNRITKGSWAVRELIYVDEHLRQIYFTGGGREPGRDPYFRHLYRVGFDGSRITLLTPEDAEHVVATPLPASVLIWLGAWAKHGQGFSPSGRYFIDTFSTVSTAPKTVLRRADGTLVATIEEADISGLKRAGWRPPIPFKVKARDNATDIYGCLWLPANLDPKQKYPVIDEIYPGPQTIRTPKSMFPGAFGQWGAIADQAMTELGFIVITVDGMGTPLRSKTFHDLSYGHYDEAGGIPDHLAALKQLAEQHPYIDLDRVGITGASAGGYAAVRGILGWPDFYKVATAFASPHDFRSINSTFADKWMGLYEKYADGTDSLTPTDNFLLAANLKGRLMLGIGEIDENAPIHQTFRLVEALIAANKDFELVVAPNVPHDVTPYMTRRHWDFFVRYLLGAIPPNHYKMTDRGAPFTF
jgi:dipeptidyl-peptidase-4